MSDYRPKATYTYPEALVRPPEAPKGAVRIGDVPVTMRDGAKLVVDIYRPEKDLNADGRYPVLLSLSPYMKDIQRKPPHWSHAIESGATSFYVPKGYIHVIAQGRGAGLSQGQWRWFDEKERTDGYDLIEWIAAQPWCTGKVGMIGDSYWSWTQYAAAIAQPPHLACICQQDSTPDFYRDVCFQGGLWHYEFLGRWIPYHTAQYLWPGPVEGKLPPMSLLEETFSRPYDGEWYRERSPWPRLDRIKVPVLSIAPQGGAMHFRGQLWAYQHLDTTKKLMVVPPTGFWSHVRYLTDKALNRQMLRWFDHWLKGIDTGIMAEPQVAIFDNALREWRYENEYPVKRTQWTKLHLREGGALGDAPTGAEKADSYRMPDAWAQISTGKPVLAYATPPLEKPMRVWGPVSLTLHVSSTQPDTVFFAKIADIAPDGTARKLNRGILKASFRALDAKLSAPGQPFHPFDKQELLEAGKVYELQIEMMPIFHTFRAGHRLRVEVASEDIEYSNQLRQIDLQLLPWPVENTIHHDREHPSHLTLPVVPDAPEIAPVKAPLADIAWPLTPGAWSPNTDGWPLTDD